MSRYQQLIERIFFNHYEEGATVVAFNRDELVACAKELGIELPKNLGDVIYSVRYRTDLPESIVATATEEREWIIEGVGRARYEFRQVKANRIVPNEQLIAIKVPDATPEIVVVNALSDEQALLAKVRYNRLIDIFLGVAAYSLQNHLRTTVSNVGQIEIDEIYVAVDKHGRQFVLPVQAKGGTDQLAVVQTSQDIACCKEKYPRLICRAISTQFMQDDLIAMFELTIQDDQVKVVNEKHYKLVSGGSITPEDLALYGATATD
jgi:hypothetical protein